MGLLGISIIVASVVYVFIRPPSWLAALRLSQRWPGILAHDSAPWRRTHHKTPPATDDFAPRLLDTGCSPEPQPSPLSSEHDAQLASERLNDSAAMAPPRPPTVQSPEVEQNLTTPESPTTPKASAHVSTQQIPTLSLSAESSASSVASSSMMPPPLSLPSRQPPSAGRIPTLPQFPARNSAQRARGPIPDRGRSESSSVGALAPPPTQSARPQKPSRKVILEAGHSPLDWARISGPNSDLRGMDPSTPFLRVTPSMLKKQSGRKGSDAWMALSGKVYNISPYAKFHPGGVPELMRGAAKDGTRLFGEIHPWVNYETMLSACMVGLLVEESEGGSSKESAMDQMD